MKKIGLVGGVSWVSTMEYYRLINEGVNNALGGLNFAECIIYSLNFGDIQEKTWDNAYDLLAGACLSLKNSGADGIALCANTAHLYIDRLQESVGLPFLHIGVETAKAVCAKEIKKVGLLGTKYSMEKTFLRDTLAGYGLETLIPETSETRDYLQHTLKEELGRGIISKATKEKYITIINGLIERGARGIILGCTEIPLLISQEDLSIPVFDTTKIHADAIVRFSVS